MKKIKLLLIIAIACDNPIFWAQTDELNLQKYWKLRGELREDFVKIGSEKGNSIVARSIRPLECVDDLTTAETPQAGLGNYGTIQ
jgi:hypothetical protein